MFPREAASHLFQGLSTQLMQSRDHTSAALLPYFVLVACCTGGFTSSLPLEGGRAVVRTAQRVQCQASQPQALPVSLQVFTPLRECRTDAAAVLPLLSDLVLFPWTINSAHVGAAVS